MLRRTLWSLALLAWLPLSAALAQNVSVRDYRVPVSRAQSLYLDFDYGYEREDGSTLSNDALVGVTYDRFYESLPFAYSLDVLGAWSRTLGPKDYLYAYNSDAVGRVKKYVWKDRDLFGSVALHGAFQRTDDRPAYDTTVGIGWGRFINATSLRKAVRIDDFFVSEGVTTDRLPRQTMLRIASIIEREPEYRQRYGADTYKKYWYEDVEENVQRSGLLEGKSLGAAGVLRMEEVLFQENIADRYYGYDATLGIKYDLQTAKKGVKRSEPAADLSVRYARPIRWDTQVGERLRVNSPMKSGEFGRAFDFSSTTSYLYELTNRVDFRADYLLGIAKETADADLRFAHTLTPTFLFYIENEVRLLATVRVLKVAQDPWTHEYKLTLTYKAF
ncbi:hypothetical protein FJZ36_14905 [Candidatus Poribacteria bacterium]|nr:hypothetical protein [Candidatus Poribacteria bacterium]